MSWIQQQKDMKDYNNQHNSKHTVEYPTIYLDSYPVSISHQSIC